MISFRAVQAVKQPSPTMGEDTSAFASLEHLLKTVASIRMMLAGIVISVMDVLWNELSAKYSRLSENVTEVRDTQLAKASP